MVIVERMPDVATERALEGPDRENYEDLYHEAFARFRSLALWNVREFDHPTPGDALAITRDLRVEGNLEARRLAERIEQACRAAV